MNGDHSFSEEEQAQILNWVQRRQIRDWPLKQLKKFVEDQYPDGIPMKEMSVVCFGMEKKVHVFRFVQCKSILFRGKHTIQYQGRLYHHQSMNQIKKNIFNIHGYTPLLKICFLWFPSIQRLIRLTQLAPYCYLPNDQWDLTSMVDNTLLARNNYEMGFLIYHYIKHFVEESKGKSSIQDILTVVSFLNDEALDEHGD